MATPTELVLDLDTITFGEMLAVELASGTDFSVLIRRQTGRRLIALYLTALHEHGTVPNWSELTSRRVLESLSSTSPSDSNGTSEASKV